MTDMDNLRAVWLEAFVEVADAGKRTAAGAAINRHQATVTRHVQKLEGWLGGALLFDGNVPAGLSQSGEAFLPFARRVLQELRDGRAAAMPPATTSSVPVSGKDIQVP